MDAETTPLIWHKVAELDELPDGRVQDGRRRAHAASRSPAVDGRYGALDNHCPHQGGPLGEGSIEKGWLRCPWHGYDYDPITGTPPPGFTDAPACFPVEVRDDGVYVGAAARARRTRAPSPTSWSRRWSRGASPTCSAWSATRTSASPTRCARRRSAATSRSSASATRARPRSRRRRTASSPAGSAACFAIAGPGLDQPAHRAVRRQGRPRAGARDLGPGAVEGARPRRVPGPRPHRRVRRRRGATRRRCCATPTTPS